jgi:hypothetical protein
VASGRGGPETNKYTHKNEDMFMHAVRPWHYETLEKCAAVLQATSPLIW